VAAAFFYVCYSLEGWVGVRCIKTIDWSLGFFRLGKGYISTGRVWLSWDMAPYNWFEEILTPVEPVDMFLYHGREIVRAKVYITKMFIISFCISFYNSRQYREIRPIANHKL